MKNKNAFGLMIAALLLAGFAAKASAVELDFDGNRGSAAAEGALGAASLPAQLAAQAPAVPASALPGRPAPEFTRDQVVKMDQVIGRMAVYAEKDMKNLRLKTNLDCLLKAGSPEEKAALLLSRGGSAYKFPAACARPATKNIIDDVLQWVCEEVVVPVCDNVCTVMSDGTESCREVCSNSVIENCGWQ